MDGVNAWGGFCSLSIYSMIPNGGKVAMFGEADFNEAPRSGRLRADRP